MDMEKLVVIINGNGGVGKDTLCEFAAEKYEVRNVSAITPIKKIASQYGWQGEKDAKSRKFLADLKQIFIEYNDLPFHYLMEEYQKFLDSSAQILFVHIREGEEIDKLKQAVEIPCITLLVRRNSGLTSWGNASDDNVEQYQYDYVYVNDKTLTEAKADFWSFLEKILTEECSRKDRQG